MQNQQTPKWLELFTTAFGAKGLVALAWWAGAYHAERIRNLQGTYPILQIHGDAGGGKSTLVSNLWKLSGVVERDHITLTNHSFGALIARLAMAVNEPVVIDDVGNASEPLQFDWDALKQLYTGNSVVRRAVGEQVQFRGALVIVGTAPCTFEQRSVAVQLKRPEHSGERSAAVQALHALQISDLAEFLTEVQEHKDMAVFCMGKAEALAFELADQVHAELHIRDARNHAQLIALLDFLDALFNVPAEALDAAKATVREMAWHTVGRTRGPVED
ncbi:hypothetical protein BVH03_25090 [Pseudomonas sp. PA15(2017)]|uniref:hypothetical protein n=1 Tax=Pseudomonas sp. PA15(2017) TaxID=1932111 RepID=UPI0009669558|nr:hypothetical protein [Pseudomonas sp. PA15(2017)]OLU22499.1 hypothetical protein BVH03_25090 [Pseudomonas sp. PA15(2017)]